jgi:hypothetical protein
MAISKHERFLCKGNLIVNPRFPMVLPQGLNGTINTTKGWDQRLRWQWRRSWSQHQCVLRITCMSGSETILTVDRTPAHCHAIHQDGVAVTEEGLDADLALVWRFMVKHWGYSDGSGRIHPNHPLYARP